MAKEEEYKGYLIHSYPNRLTDEESENFSVRGHVALHTGNEVCEYSTVIFNRVPENAWEHDTEEQADQAFIRIAKEWIDEQI